MDPLIAPYKNRFNLLEAQFLRIEHEDALIATVYKVTLPNGQPFILKICSRKGDYFREAYFLYQFQGKLPIPRLIQLVPPDGDLDGAILMEYLPGQVLKIENLNSDICYETGSLLARIHLYSVKGYGDLTEPNQLSSDPRVPFTQKFEKELEECRDHLPSVLIEQSRKYYDRRIDLLLSTDGPCLVHRDFRPGNLIADHGHLQGIIDWSSARGSFAEEDFCPLESGGWSSNPSYMHSFLKGYASIRKIPDYHRVMPLIRLCKAIGVIGFMAKRKEGKGNKFYQLNRQYLETFLKDNMKIYRNNLKNWDFCKEALQNLCSERATLAYGQGASENKNSEEKPLLPKTNSSGCFGIHSLKTLLGPMIAIANEETLFLLEFADRKGLEQKIQQLKDQTKASISSGYTPPIRSIEKELGQYFEGKLKEFKTPLFLFGSPFQRRVWENLKKIPYGKTVSYADLAIAIGCPISYRAVARANSANPFPILIPCHRVINKNGKLGGYSGGITRKKWLIQHELHCKAKLLTRQVNKFPSKSFNNLKLPIPQD